jgi:hypothetical protein
MSKRLISSPKLIPRPFADRPTRLARLGVDGRFPTATPPSPGVLWVCNLTLADDRIGVKEGNIPRLVAEVEPVTA